MTNVFSLLEHSCVCTVTRTEEKRKRKAKCADDQQVAPARRRLWAGGMLHSGASVRGRFPPYLHGVHTRIVLIAIASQQETRKEQGKDEGETEEEARLPYAGGGNHRVSKQNR